MPGENRNKYLTRPPVSESQLKTLMDTAINLHQSAIDASRDRRWFVAPGVAAIASCVGFILGASFQAFRLHGTLVVPYLKFTGYFVILVLTDPLDR